ncbi:phytyl ester synthase 1, chloroplastic-like [Argentina anserina]|uniref:phytyl ester synthase 1, chloroplastic-like n=1 Tax=Argentina anserina TaxID=57926 RepID=UPI00217682DF|nr:phytyl ester synthase 1, chloroplastic-like [Potentilla anserina]
MASNALSLFSSGCGWLWHEPTSPPPSLFTSSKLPSLATTRRLAPVFTTSTATSVLSDNAYTKAKKEEVEAKEQPINGALEDGDDQVSFNQFFQQSKDLLRSDDQFSSGTASGPPRWFSPVDCGAPTTSHDSPLLFFLPGIDGTGLGLVRHHQKLAKHFQVSCLHIPPKDRTPFTDLVKLVERTIRSEHHASPGRPIYLVGESLGACLALSVAALNPDIDLVLILANPATSFSRSPLQAVLPLLRFLPDTPILSLPHILSAVTGAMVAGLEKGVGALQLPQTVEKLSRETVAQSISNLSVLADILPRETLLWKLQMISSASSYVNSRLHAVKAQTVILASGRDPLLPSREEGHRLCGLLATCQIRTFDDCGHFLFLEDAFDLLTAIKNVGFYRRSKERDFVSDYIPPSPSEVKGIMDKNRWVNLVMNPVMLSTLADGKIVRGFAGIPKEGPVLYVGYHMLLGFEIVPLVTQLLEQNNIHLRGIAHPMMFLKWKDESLPDSFYDDFRLMGAVPVSGKNFFKLLSTKSHVLLYPGGVREALHRKGEAYKLFWPERSEFVRMAARFGAKIVPFGAVGEDDIGDLFLDYEDQMKIPFLKKFIEDLTAETAKVRSTVDGETGNQAVHLPGIVPKFPGRFYYKFGKPIETAGRKQALRDREKAHDLYLEVQSEVEKCLAYLLKKRESDPYRNLAARLQYQAIHGFTSEVPSFDLD